MPLYCRRTHPEVAAIVHSTHFLNAIYRLNPTVRRPMPVFSSSCGFQDQYTRRMSLPLQKGFSLIEALATLAIVAIALSVGIPSFQGYIQNNRQTTAINDLATALQLARNTAITRRVQVTLCKSSDGATCRTGSGSGDWSQGWMIFTNPNDDSTLDAGEELLRVHGALPGTSTFIGNTRVVNRISFSAQGLSRGSNGTLTHCDARGASHASALVISVAGQVRRAIDTNSDGIVDVAGVNVTCPT
jgi:type IV fimbrial biogenesis protein FimT